MAETESGAPAGAVEVGEDDFKALLKKKFNPRSDDAEQEIGAGVGALASFLNEVLAEQKRTTLPTHGVRAIREAIAEIDRLLSAQVNEILHMKDFQKLEGAWRGLKFLCDRTETDTDLRIQVMNISKDELSDELADYRGVDWDHSPIFREIYTKNFSQMNGDPISCIVGDFQFDHSASDVELMRDISKIAAASHAPFISGVSPELFDIDDWSNLYSKRNLAEIVARPTHTAWRSLREEDDSRYIGLAAPRFMGRRAYGAENPVDAFDYTEDTLADGADGTVDATKFCWINACYAMAANITRAHKLYGWSARIRGVESGGMQDALPTHVFENQKGAFETLCPTEVAIDDRRENEMAQLGLMPFIHMHNTDKAVFVGAQSLHKPPVFADNPQGNVATANAALGARLPYLFACSRFAHYLKHMVRAKIGSYMERQDMQRWLSEWIMDYVESSDNAGEIAKAKRPLKSAEVVVEEDPENPGMYGAKFFLRPHYQLEGANVSLRLVSKLPSQAGSG